MGKLRLPGVHTLGGNGPARWVTESPALPDLILGHEVHALGRSRADRFLRHAAWGLGTPPRSGLWLRVSSLLGDRLLSNEGRGGGARAAPGGIGAAGLSSPRSTVTVFARLPAHQLCPGLSQPSSSAENLGETSRPYTPSSF